MPSTTALRDLAPIGDGRTVALVDRAGRIEWMPLPGLVGTPVFAELLDPAEGGVLELAPTGEYTVTRRYIPQTNVLETTFTTANGAATLTDALVTGVAGRLPWVELTRCVQAVSGEVEFAWRVQPGTALGECAPWLEPVDGRVILRCADVSIAVLGADHGPHESEDDPTVPPRFAGSFRTAADADGAPSRHILVLVSTQGEPLHLPPLRAVEQNIDHTIENWRRWSREFEYEGPWTDAVQRSALALKLLIYSPTGAIAAAATTSLPENPAGGKNWDYRFAWVRDLAYTATALVAFGLREEPHAAVSWMLRTIRDNGPDVQVMYTLHGGTETEVREHDVAGWNGIGPVVSGNPAQGQLQLGVYGDLVSICRTYVDAGNLLDAETGTLLARTADVTCDLWRHADSGMWELPEAQHYTSSKMGCWKALDDAIALADAGHIPDNAARWRAERARIRAWVEEHCWSDELQAYTMHPDTDALDASVLLHAPTGFDRGERMAATIDAITAHLGAGDERALVYRYSGADAEEHTFTACAFWRAEALACVGRHDEAIDAMNTLVAQANDVGIFTEMISADDGSFWGNTPQALSHLAVVTAALTMRNLIPASHLERRAH